MKSHFEIRNSRRTRSEIGVLLGILAGLFLFHPLSAAPADNAFLNFVKARAADLRGHDQAPATLADWQKQRVAIRAGLLKAWGGFPKTPVSLNPRKLGELQRDGYRIEKIVFQTLPDVWMTANAYVPDKAGKLPTVLCVHGHWRGAKQDPNVTARCVGLAKNGFFVLVVDAFGAGERGLGKALGEYHGEMVAATLWPVGRPLSGLQVYENGRAVDYLLTRPEVDGDRIGITGASGGGNQTMYAGAWDERFKAVVPTCSVGNYQAYLGAACCMCEVVPGVLRFTEEWGVLSLTAPRALMINSATRDAFQFSVGEAKKSLALVEPVYRLHGELESVRHSIFESPHAYNAPMREAMYGWMTLHLKGEGAGSPIPEGELKLDDPEILRCYPGDTRPEDWMTIPKFAAREGRKLVEKIALPMSAQEWNRMAERMKQRLDHDVLGGTKPNRANKSPKLAATQGQLGTGFIPEPGIQLGLVTKLNYAPPNGSTVLFLTMAGESATATNELASALRRQGHKILTFSLRATGEHAYSRDQIGRAPDHNTGEWSLLLGRPLLGQWVQDVRAALDLHAAEGKSSGEVSIIGIGPAGIVAICAAALDSRIKKVTVVGSLTSYISDVPYVGQRLGLMAPGILRDVGDIAHLAALVAPRPLTIAGGVNGGGHRLGAAELQKQFAFASHVYQLKQSGGRFSVTESADVDGVISALK